MPLRSDPEFIRTISSIRDSYYIFLRMTIQLDNVVWMCCDSHNVLRINLCSSQVTDCCYNNDHLTTNEGKHLIFVGPDIVPFEKDPFLFSRKSILFYSEMLIHRPTIGNLKMIRTDLGKAILNCYVFSIFNKTAKES